MNKQDILTYVGQKYIKAQEAKFKVGDTVRVSVKITEGDTTRVQAFEGTVISVKASGSAKTFTVRKISFGIGVERCFPYNSPNVEKIDVVRSGHARRAKLYYLRERIGRAARLEEKEAPGQAANDNKKAPEASSAKPAAVELATADKK
jgi:large subunit ribosomal protein L19